MNAAANIAGVFSAGKQIVNTTDEDWDFIMDVNLRGVFNCIRAELQRMDKDARIVSTSSVTGLVRIFGVYFTSFEPDYES